MSTPFVARWTEDSSAMVVARLASATGTGAATGANGEGQWVKIAELSSITYKVFDETDESITDSGTVTIASSVLDSPVTGQSALWNVDAIGYNFKHRLPAAGFPNGSRNYRAEYKFTFTDGSVSFGVIRGYADKVLTS